MRTLARIYHSAPAGIAQALDALFRTHAGAVTNSLPSSEVQPSELWRNVSSTSGPRTAAAPLIYVVDDDPELTELYTTLLEATGYSVRTFNDRAEALAVLTADRVKPDLLITDYLGLSMPVDSFLHDCLVAHPALRILMASGFSQAEVCLSQAKPNRFLQKPFTPEQLRQGVRFALTA